MAKDPTQGPVTTYDADDNPIVTNVDPPEIEEEVTSEEEEAPEEAPEEVDEPDEEIWDRLTLTGAESDPEKGEVSHVEFTCDRCKETKEGMLLPEGTVGFYALDSELGWAKYANEGEEILCDACMQLDERYLADYPDEAAAYAKVLESEEAPEKEEAPKEEESPEEANEPEEDAPEEEFVTHEHEVKPPLTYNEAETMLMETSFVKLREMAIADDIKPERSRVKVMRQLLDYWFPPASATPAGEVEPEMSVRIRRAKGLM